MASSDQDNTPLFSEFPPSSPEAWHEAAVASLKGGVPFEKQVVTRTPEGIDLQPIYWRRDLEGIGHLGTLPGAPPYVRGGAAAGYVATPWLVCQEVGLAEPTELNAEARHGLDRGQTALGLVLDEPTRRGLDPDAVGADEVGRGGASICDLDDLRVALEGIDSGRTPFHVVTGATAVPFLALAAALGEERRGSSKKLRGCIAADPLGELARHGSIPLPLEEAYDHLAATVRWAAKRAPGLGTVVAEGCPYHEAGASAVQELACAVATAVDALRALLARGLTVNEVAAALRFTYSIGSRFFIEVAKLRAARLLWAQVVEAFGGDAQAQRASVHGRTSAWNLTARDPWVNMLRNTTEAYSAVIGGVDSLHVRPFDEAVRPPTEFARRVSRNVQLLLRHEAHATHPIDPAGGSYFVEKLTDQVGRAAWELFQEIERRGGMARALADGWVQAQIAATARKRREAIETRREVLLGTNRYPNLKEKPLDVPAVDARARRERRLESLRRHRAATPTAARAEAIAALSVQAGAAGRTGAALVEQAARAAAAGATVGELARALAGDSPKPGERIAPLEVRRAAEGFEQLRANAERAAARDLDEGTGLRPLAVFLANVGPRAQHKARAEFSLGFFEVGGFEVLTNDGFPTAAAAARAALDSRAGTVVICSTDDAYPLVVPELARLVKAGRPETTVVLAGKPAAEHEAAYREAGVDHAIFLNGNCYELLRTLQAQKGVTDER
jgi:methylmalonyl-CoA mutase